MKEVRGRASAVVGAPLEESFTLLAAVEHYPSWYSEFFREVDVLERNSEGRPTKAWARLHVARSPFAKDFELIVAVRAERPRAVFITRLPNEPTDPERLELAWRLREESGTRIELAFDAAVAFVPGFIPVGDVGDRIAATILGGAVQKLVAA
jgi:hypothetical protein